MNRLLKLLEYISEAEVFGLPLDSFLHGFIAFLIFYFILRLYKDKKIALLFVLYLGMLKEVFDLASQGQEFSAAALDMLSNLSLIFLYLIFKFWSRAKNR